jgi:poly-gamma-glutamate capsule biosynthesis protein CapA/YwtB (metallophosphatase superfamily)
MALTMILSGDVNLMNVADPAVPFALVGDTLRAADIVFSNLECCLYRPPAGHAVENEGFYADPGIAGEALKRGGIQAVGIANNVNYGEAAILSSIARLDALGVPHAGAGADRKAAHRPVVLDRGGSRLGVVQRSSVYWPTNHEAGENSPGIAVIRGHTAYHVPLHKKGPPMNRPGVPPEIVTWADPDYLAMFRDDIAALRRDADIVVASCHWGLGHQVLRYMTEIAHAAIDAGADLVIGHGPPFVLPIEVYQGRPIFYGLGSFSFHTGHGGRAHGDWLGMMTEIEYEGGCITGAGFRFVRHDAHNRTVPRAPAEEGAAFDELARHSGALGARLELAGDLARVDLGRA